jgi:hypothetical protein
VWREWQPIMQARTPVDGATGTADVEGFYKSTKRPLQGGRCEKTSKAYNGVLGAEGTELPRHEETFRNGAE